MRTIVIVLAIFLCGCGSHDDEGRLLSKRNLLAINTQTKVRVIGVARYMRTTGPSVDSEDFELRVYPTESWGSSLDGQRIEVIGVLHDTAHSTPPDPSIEPGEYWLSDVHWKRVPAEGAP